MDAAESAGVAEEPSPPKLERRLLAMMAVCSVATLALLWSARVLPMTDVPQHEVQLALWLRLGDPASEAAQLYELNWATPYLLFGLVGRTLASFLPVWVALRCMLCLGAVGLPWSLVVLLRRTGGDPAWALIGFPLAFGVSFYWGFVNFLLALPVGVLFLAYALRHSDSQTRAVRAVLGVGACVLFAFHPLVWLPFVLAVGVTLSCGSQLALRERVVRILPLLPSFLLAASWKVLTRSDGGGLLALEDLWSLSLWRLAELPAFLLGPDRPAVAVIGCLALGCGLSASHVSRDRKRWLLPLLGLSIFMLAPLRFSGIDFLYKRFAVLFVVFLLVALEPRGPSRRRTAGHAVLMAVALLWCVVLGGRFQFFQAEVDRFDRVTSVIPARSKVLGLIPDSRLDPIPGNPLLHLAVKLQVEQEMHVEHSFAHYRHLLVNFRPEAKARFAPVYKIEHPTAAGVAEELEVGAYDYVVVRSDSDVGERFPALQAWKALATEGAWSLYGR